MEQSQTALILTTIILVQVLFLVFYDHTYFGLYIDIVVVILLLAAIYLGYRYLNITSKMPIRVTKLKNAEEYEFMVERERRKQIDKLFQTKQMQELQKMKTSRLSSADSKKKEDIEFLAQLQEKENQIFDSTI